MHICDRPGCINPKHLKIGTQKDNMADAAKKGRMAFGVRSGKAKLNPKIVRAMRRLSECGTTRSAIAKKFNSSETNVLAVISRKTWRRVL
jgi:DNA invertase Pin-like site-specific DNA recombinase